MVVVQQGSNLAFHWWSRRCRSVMRRHASHSAARQFQNGRCESAAGSLNRPGYVVKVELVQADLDFSPPSTYVIPCTAANAPEKGTEVARQTAPAGGATQQAGHIRTKLKLLRVRLGEAPNM